MLHISQDALFQITFILALAIFVATFIGGYGWLMRMFRRHAGPQPLTFTQRWLAGFISIVPLCTFASYLLLRTQPSALLESLGFGVLGAVLAATSSTSIMAELRRHADQNADQDAVGRFSDKRFPW